jgi:iron complex transport system ATP-binding protein
MTLLSLRGLAAERGGRPVLHGVGLDIGEGELVGLIGPNGGGKTTLLRAALGLMPHGGRSSLTALPMRARARRAAFLPQSRDVAWALSVEALVALGRGPYGDAAVETGQRAVDRALARMEIEALRTRPATELSGGELARALIARLLAQETPLILADEPIAGLDPAAQIGAMEVFAGLAREGRGLLVSLHDLGLAARHCTRLIALAEGRIAADGPPAQVLTPELHARVFGITAFCADTEDGLVYQPLRTVSHGAKT